MKLEQKQVADFMVLAKQEIPTFPIIPSQSVCALRLDLIGEEYIELANSMGFEVSFNPFDHRLAPRWSNIVDTADAIADLLYVVLGTAVACGINIDPIFQEVHRSNMSKFIDGSFRPDGKYVKGPSYSPANLKPLIDQQTTTGK